MTDAARDVVLTTRATLVRNLDGMRFPPCLPGRPDDDEARRTQERVEEAFLRANLRGEYARLPLDCLKAWEISALAERGLVDRRLAQRGVEGRAALVRRDQRLCACVNDGDHLRMHAVWPGLAPEAAYRAVSGLDAALGETLDYAFDGEYGYLTADPAEAGTGLRVRVRMHLPALLRGGQTPLARPLCEELRVGLSRVRDGDMVELTNVAGMGMSEAEILETVTTAAHRIVARERQAREAMLLSDKESLEQALAEALREAATAQALRFEQFQTCWSTLRLSVVAGILPHTLDAMDALYLSAQPGHLDLRAGAFLEDDSRQTALAELLRETLDETDETYKTLNL